jgi:23S rRNA pseudouridine1911/1915/1917 synthase
MKLFYHITHDQSFPDFIASTQLPNKFIRTILSQKLVWVNNQQYEYIPLLKTNDLVAIMVPEESIDQSIVHQDISLNILYEDDYLLVINKPAKIPVMVTKSHPLNTLSNALCYYYQTHQINSKIHLVNRLDKDTSGLMVVAKNRYVKYLLSDDLKNKIKREYLCVVHGKLQDKSGTISHPIGKSNPEEIKRSVMADGDNAVTHYQVIAENEQYSRLIVQLETGRTHQIRVHLSYIGHPIVGDQLYGMRSNNSDNLFLCSHQIGFTHPITQENIHIKIDLPDFFERLSL